MTYTLGWYAPNQILYLELDGQPTVQELQTINQEVVDILDTHQAEMNILIDATNLQTGYHTANNLRDTQKYMNHPSLNLAFVITDNKLNRLITLMAFSLARAKFMQFDDLQKAEAFFRQRGFTSAMN